MSEVQPVARKPVFRTSEPRNCLVCQKEFSAALTEIKRGNGLYCSKSCAAKVGTRTKGPRVQRVTLQCQDCGQPIHVTLAEAQRQPRKYCSCHCASKHKNLKHGRCGTYLYTTWCAMLQRCHNPKSTEYHNYGGRGIHVCEQWRCSFTAFRDYVLSSMGERPSSAHTLERPRNDVGYQPGNVVWATQLEQSRNMRRNLRLTLDGRTLVITDWASRLGVSTQCIKGRLFKQGWSIRDALTTPSQRRLSSDEIDEIHRLLEDGELTHEQIATMFRVNRRTIDRAELRRKVAS
jgi:hypothetical protein